MTAVPRTRSYITTVVVENDFIPRYTYYYWVYISTTHVCMVYTCTYTD